MKRVTPILILAAATMLAPSCKKASSPVSPSPVAFSTVDIRVGTGAEATTGKAVTVNYTGWLYDSTAVDNKGLLFDTTSGRGPFYFVVGAGQVIPGWDRGVVGMKVGGLRRLIIPPDLAYGPYGSGGVIPPNATLVFDIELLSVQ